LEKIVGMQDLAKALADKVPDKKFSPADLQDFLLLRRDKPQKAVDEVADWAQETIS